MSMKARRYWPALDGVRTIGIVAVIAYHLSHLGGGWIGVDVFFVLSGYLITTLLLAERVESGRVALGRFWARRARRLLPAVLLLLIVLGVYAWVGGPGVVPAQLRSPALATLFYVANWQQIAFSHNYFAAFTAPTPLLHTWSLAIEEQYYVIWPILVLAITASATLWRPSSGRARHTVPAGGAPRSLSYVTALLVVLSAVAMGVTAHLVSVNRAYLGTDTRAWELLVGGMAAMLVAPRPSEHRQGRWAATTVVAAAALATIIGLAGMSVRSAQPSMWIWDGGLVGAALCTITVITGSIRAPRGPVALALSLPPVRWLGRVSYSLYLWHWPVIDLVNPATIGLSGVELLAVRLGLMIGVTCASYYLVELPLRRADWATWRRRAMVPIGVAATVGLLLAATVAPPLAGTGQLATANPKHVPTASSAAGPMTPASISTPFPAASATDPLRVWILGDSVMEDSSPGVTAALEATGRATVVANSSFGGWGLSTQTAWAHESQQIIDQYHPQMILGTWSWDDGLAETSPKAYTALLHQALATWMTPGNGVKLVVLFQYPQGGPSPHFSNPSAQRQAWVTQTTSQNAWDAIAQKVVLDFPGHALYLSTGQLFAPGGRYFAWFRTPAGSWVRARKIDGTHMCPYGAAELGQLVVNDLTRSLGLGPPRAGWQFGNWTKDPRYNDPPGACPADQPPAHYRGVLVPAASASHPTKGRNG
jgi:peptidoglycan/LPS O-acetylase OafA/YrhL